MLVIGLCGLAGSGKSTAARYLVEHHGFVRRPFAALLKRMLRTLLHGRGVPSDVTERMVDGDLKDTLTPYLGGASPRRAMETLGTEWGRALSSDLWIETWAASLAGLDRVVSDDLRFENEAAAIQTLSGYVLRIERAGVGSTSGALHTSEMQQVSATVGTSNNGIEIDLERTLESMMRDVTWAVQ
jgi:hypothetical protein